jgi:hypothetical protein
MKRRTISLMLAFLPFAAQAQQGIQQTAQAERFFEPTLAAAMQRDYQLAQKNGVPPTLNGDPFVDVQEWEIANLSIRAASSGEQATGMVSFVNLKQKKTLAVELVQTRAGWRIADIADAGGSLRALY